MTFRQWAELTPDELRKEIPNWDAYEVETSSDIYPDNDNPSQEQLVLQARILTRSIKESDVEYLKEREAKDGWIFQSRFFHSTSIAYIIFTRPIRTEVDWYGKMIDNRKMFEHEVERVTSQYADLVFNRA